MAVMADNMLLFLLSKLTLALFACRIEPDGYLECGCTVFAWESIASYSWHCPPLLVRFEVLGLPRRQSWPIPVSEHRNAWKSGPGPRTAT